MFENHHVDNECQGHWQQTIGPDMPCKIDEGIIIILLNPPIVSCKDCGLQFFIDGFEKKMHRFLAKSMLFDYRPLTADQIRFVRSFAGLSQADVALELDIRNESISAIESRKDPQTLQPSEQVRFKLLLINKLGFDIPNDAQLWKVEKVDQVAGSEALIRRLDANAVLSEMS